MARGSAPGERRGGRQRGTPNKRTTEREAEMARAAEQIESVLENSFNGDAHSLLVAIYKDKSRPIELRLEAAKSAVRYERPALASVDTRSINENIVYQIGDSPLSVEEWESKYCHEKSGPCSH